MFSKIAGLQKAALPSRLHAQIVGHHLFMSPAGAILLIHSLSMCGLCLVHIVVSALRPLLGGMHTHRGCTLWQQKACGTYRVAASEPKANPKAYCILQHIKLRNSFKSAILKVLLLNTELRQS